MWLQDFLPEDAPNCRITIYGYKSNIFDERTHPRFELVYQADRLNATLNRIRNTPEVLIPMWSVADSDETHSG